MPAQNHRDSNSTQKPPKIPDYAKDYKNEYLFLRGIDKEFEYFLDNFSFYDKGLFNDIKVDRIIKFLDKY